MQSPNLVITAAAAAAYFPGVSADITGSPVFQDMLDDAMAQINERLSVDLSGGPDAPITHVFRYESMPVGILRLPVPADPTVPFVVKEGEQQRTMTANEFTSYSNMLHRNPGYANFYYFDRVYPLGTTILPPITVTYTPRDSVFRVVKQALLDLVRVKLRRYGLDATESGVGAGLTPVKSITDDAETITYADAPKDADFHAAEEAVLDRMQLNFRGPRIG